MSSEGPFSDEPPLLPKIFAWSWPQTLPRWGFWGLGFLSLGYGLISSLAAMNVDGLCLAAIGCAVLGVASPNPFGIAMKEMVPGASDQWSVEPLPPMHPSQWHLDRPRWNEKFKEWLPDPLARYEMDGPEISCKKIGDQWAIYYGGQEYQCEECQGRKVVSGKKCSECGGGETRRFDNEIEADEQIQKLISRHEGDDAQAVVFTEHPRNSRYRRLYNATPPMITATLLWHALSVMFIVGMFLGFPSEDRELFSSYAIGLILFGTICAFISQWYNRGIIEAWDTVTSIVKYVDEGHGELVGQVRPATFFPPDIVHVDGYRDPDWTFDNLVAWAWSYRVYECEEERYYDAQSKTWKTRTVCNWRRVRGGAGSRDFMLHDGTGGILVDIDSFRDSSFGEPIWTREEPGLTGGGELYTGSGDIRRHQWSLWALQLGEPVYLMARIRSRPFDEIPKGTVANNASRVHHTLVAVGEDAVRRAAKLRKGTEFSVLKPKTSAVSRLGAIFLLIAAGFVMAAIGG